MLQIEERKSQLSLNLQSLLNTLKLIKKEKQTAEAVSKLSEEQLRHEIERFKLGKSTSYQVSQFQQDVVEAKQQEIMISIRQEKIRVEILALTGEFREKYKLNQFTKLDHPAIPRWPLDESAAFLKGAGVKI